jgi:hypothetical protein
MEMEGPARGSVEKGDPREWSAEEVATCLRSWGTGGCYQTAAEQVLQHGMPGSVFLECTLDDLQGVCAHGRAHAHIRECNTAARMRAPWHTHTAVLHFQGACNSL